MSRPRLVYFFPSNFLHHPGLLKKVSGQIEALQTVATVELVAFGYRSGMVFFRKYLGGVIYEWKAIYKAFFGDILYMRYNPKMVFLTLMCGVLSWSKPVFLEHNVDLEKELPYLKRVFELSMHRLLMLFLKQMPIWHVAVSASIGKSIQKKGVLAHHILVIQNGYSMTDLGCDVADQSVIDRVTSLRKTADKIAIFVGNGYVWHGLDVAIDLVKKQPNLILLVVGPYPEKRVDDRVVFLGSLSLATLREVYGFVDIGIGSLRWDLVGAREGSPLKTREYLAMGLPILVNYHDMASDIEALKPYVFTLQDNPDALSEICQKKWDKTHIAQTAQTYLSWTATLKQVLNRIERMGYKGDEGSIAGKSSRKDVV